ncbi:MAG: response regulator [Bacteriodetes bacterium]|nr:response regulator [Bacteroidota bacterium]
MANEDTLQRSVLVVDDNVWMQRIIAKILLSYGLKPLLASNGYEAVALAVDNNPVAVILDIIMPDLSGHQTLRLLKSITTTRNIPVLMITVASDAENLGIAIKLGASGFIRKPFTRTTIFEKLADVLGEDALIDCEFHAIKNITDAELDQLSTTLASGTSAAADLPTTTTTSRHFHVITSPLHQDVHSITSLDNTPPTDIPKPSLEAMRDLITRSARK